MIHLIVLLIVLSIVVRIVVRLVAAPFRYSRRSWSGYGDPYYNPYRYGCRRNRGFAGGLLPIIALVALDRLFTRRY
jgi:hypothetical protein